MVVNGSISNLGASQSWKAAETGPWAATESCVVLACGVGLSYTNATAESSDSMDGVSLVIRSNCTAISANRSLTVLSCSIFKFSSRGGDEDKTVH